MKIEEIIVGTRVRQEAGELTLLKQSIKTVGLVNPIVVNEKNGNVIVRKPIEA